MSNEALLVSSATDSKDSNAGRKSLIIWLVLLLSLILLSASFYVVNELSFSRRTTYIQTLLGLLILTHISIISPIGYITGAILGLVDLFKNQQKKTINILGIVLNSVFLFLLIALDAVFIKLIFGFGKNLD